MCGKMKKLIKQINQKSIIMNKFNFTKTLVFMLPMVILCSSCQAIEGIFKAGVWVGVIAVVVVLALIL